MSPGRWGKGKTLTFERARADNVDVSSQGTPGGRHAARRHLLGERGQAMVEFALIAPLFLLIVVGIIQFGVALNYWLDMQRIANQGARWAVVNNYPGCPRTGPNTPCSPTLQQYLAGQKGANGESLRVYVCFPNTTSKVGDPVKVNISQPFRFMAIVPIPSLTISASTQMRLEQDAGRYAADGPC